MVRQWHIQRRSTQLATWPELWIRSILRKVMIPDLDVDRSAITLIKQHGEDAPIHAAMEADAILDKGDLDGYAAWKRIIKAVEELLYKERLAGVTVQ